MKLRAALFGVAGALLLIFGASSAFAENKTFTLTLPTQYENSDPLPAAAITRTSIKCGNVDGGPYTERGFATSGVTSLVVNFGAGNFYCVATVTASGTESGPSNQVFFTVTLRPRAPGLSVN